MDELSGQTASRGEDEGGGLPCLDNSLLPLFCCRWPIIILIAHLKLFTPHPAEHCGARAGRPAFTRKGEGNLQMNISYFHDLFKQDKIEEKNSQK